MGTTMKVQRFNDSALINKTLTVAHKLALWSGSYSKSMVYRMTGHHLDNGLVQT